jgi:hypothetical protein
MKKEITVSLLSKKLCVRLGQGQVILPKDIQEKVDAYWDELLNNGKNYKRGEVFTVVEKKETDNTINILVKKTDYAHYLYCQNVDNLGYFEATTSPSIFKNYFVVNIEVRFINEYNL